MKALTLIAILLLTWQWGAAQSKTRDQYSASFKLFEEGKIKHNNSYEFTLKKPSMVGDFGGTTTFVVKEGKLVERRYFWEHPREDYSRGWVETGEELGSHTEEGCEPMTMDDIYAKAVIYARDNVYDANKNEFASTSWYYFETENEGIISLFGSSILMRDDHFSGYRILSFKWL